MNRTMKVAATVLCISMLLCTGCKSSEVKSTEELINSIGEVTLESKDAIEAAQSSYDTLGNDQAKVENLQVLQDAEEKYNDILQSEAAPIEEAIAAIPQPVTIEAADMVSRAESLYNKAKESVRNAVSNIDALNDAKKTLEDIKVQTAIDAIDQIGTVTLESQSAIDAASVAYQAVPTARKGDVTNYGVLADAQSAYTMLQKEAAELAKQQAAARLVKKEDSVENRTWYYPSCYPKYINTRSFVLPYLGEKNGHTYMRLIFNYAGDDWIFMDKAIINIDGEVYDTVEFDYFDIERDTAWGANLYECVDILPTDKQIEMLHKIADSSKTVIRLKGTHYYDLTISEKDKQGIKDILSVYDFMN